jgi:hypothetical protein
MLEVTFFGTKRLGEEGDVFYYIYIFVVGW